MHEILRILYWNCQGIGKKRSELLHFSNILKIDIIFLQETYLNLRKSFNLPIFHISRIDRTTTGATNFGGIAILVRWSLTHTAIQISTLSIENTIIHTEVNGHELRIGSLEPIFNSSNLRS